MIKIGETLIVDLLSKICNPLMQPLLYLAANPVPGPKTSLGVGGITGQ